MSIFTSYVVAGGAAAFATLSAAASAISAEATLASCRAVSTKAIARFASST